MNVTHGLKCWHVMFFLYGQTGLNVSRKNSDVDAGCLLGQPAFWFSEMKQFGNVDVLVDNSNSETFEISPRLVKKTTVFASFRLQPSFHVFSDVQFIFMFCFYDPFGFCNLEVMTSSLGVEAFEFNDLRLSRQLQTGNNTI